MIKVGSSISASQQVGHTRRMIYNAFWTVPTVRRKKRK